MRLTKTLILIIWIVGFNTTEAVATNETIALDALSVAQRGSADALSKATEAFEKAKSIRETNATGLAGQAQKLEAEELDKNVAELMQQKQAFDNAAIAAQGQLDSLRALDKTPGAANVASLVGNSLSADPLAGLVNAGTRGSLPQTFRDGTGSTGEYRTPQEFGVNPFYGKDNYNRVAAEVNSGRLPLGSETGQEALKNLSINTDEATLGSRGRFSPYTHSTANPNGQITHHFAEQDQTLSTWTSGTSATSPSRVRIDRVEPPSSLPARQSTPAPTNTFENQRDLQRWQRRERSGSYASNQTLGEAPSVSPLASGEVVDLTNYELQGESVRARAMRRGVR